MKTLLRGGSVVSGQGVQSMDVLLQDEHVAAAAPGLSAEDAEVVDCTGKLLSPDFIDAHTHFDLEEGGTITADDFETGSRAALRGATATIIDYAGPNKGGSLSHGLERWREKAVERTACDYGFHMTIDDWYEGISWEIGEMVEKGIPTFKLYITHPAMMLPEGDMYEALKRLKEVGGIAGVHCEDSAMIDAPVAEAKAAGRIGPSSHPRTRPAPLEAEAVGHLLRMAQIVDIPVIIVHPSARESLEEVRAARRRGQTVYVETCPHYLLLERSVYDVPDFLEATKFMCAPPIEKSEDRQALWTAIQAGEIQVTKDHCSFTLAQKRAGRYDFTKIPGGLPGVEHRGVLLYTYGGAAGRIDEADMCRVLSENAAKLYGLWPRKDVIAPGSDADIVVYDPAVSSVISAVGQIQNTDYTPYEGFATAGRIQQVYLQGALAVDCGEVLPTQEAFLQRGRCSL